MRTERNAASRVESSRLNPERARMLKCRDVSELASDYIDRGLPPRSWLSVRVHLIFCDMCRRYVDQLRKTSRLLGQGTLPPPTSEIEERLVAATQQSSPDDQPIIPPG